MDHEQPIGDDAGRGPAGFQPAAAAFSGARLETVVGRLISERRRRGAFFAGDLFSDPAWDLLLALTLAKAQQQRLTVSGLCDLAAVPVTTALRWIGKLAEQGLLVRRGDMTDRRRQFVELSSQGHAAMAAYCLTSAAALPLAA